ncbi:alkaline protease [Myriangium duriaei CBS 260.36]|uniref:Alkaline protease n=1 Tax=Myriangium duriaei CBS 260.36 TaxID=1168546 RepID=A0A9P4J0K5_9PEZI|nr:alkaline protease [Myriangium duriaei CBS 260.36]
MVRDLHSRATGNKDGEELGGVTNRYAIGVFQAYAGHFHASLIEELRLHSDVADIEPDQILDAWLKRLVKQKRAPYNLHRISHRGVDDPDNYWYISSAGSGTYVYVVDSGINKRHVEFGSRASFGYNAFANTSAHDTDGHGTYIAGIIGGKTYGVAKKTNLIALKIIDNKRTSTSIMLEGYHWAVNNILKKEQAQKSAISLSVSGRYQKAINDAIDAAFRKGVVTVVPAGDSGINAKAVSPASAKHAITVGASDQTRARANFSNFGPAVNIFAPGVDICAAWNDKKNKGIRKATGTAEAAAHVAALVVYFTAFNLLRTAEMTWAFLQIVSTAGVVSNAARSSDLFAYNLSGK